MSDYVRPCFENVTVYEALLTRADVERYSVENGISFDEAVEILGRDYIAKYGQYCIVGGNPLKLIALDS